MKHLPLKLVIGVVLLFAAGVVVCMLWTVEEYGPDEEEKDEGPAIGFMLRVGVVTDMSREEMETLSIMIKKTSRRLAETTGGMMYIREAIFTDNDPRGDMLYSPKQSRGVVPRNSNNFSFGPANWSVGTILHEFGHFKLGLDDEYDTSIYGVEPETNVFCNNCIMGLIKNAGWCDSSNHPEGCYGNYPGCRETLVRTFGRRCPQLAEAFNYPKEKIVFPPETKITIIDTKPYSNKETGR
jgi:hypothetical protein